MHRIRLFSLFGFEVGIDASWFLLAVLIAWTLASSVFPALAPDLGHQTHWAMALAATVGLMVSIVFHEAAHSLVARHYGMAIKGITLFIFGGVAELTGEPARPRDEWWMAAAGPAASGLLGLVCYGLYAVLEGLAGMQAVTATLWYLAETNAALAIFNLIPAFPLDGGRMLRAALWHFRGNYEAATRNAATIGSTFGAFLMIMGLIGLLQGDFIGGLWRFLIGLFLRNAAVSSVAETVTQRVLSQMPLQRLMNTQPVSVAPTLLARDFVEDYVCRFHHRWFPVLEDGVLIGSVSTQQLADLDKGDWQSVPIGRIMRPLTDAQLAKPEQTAFAALTQMRTGGENRLMIARNGRLLGIISTRDLVEAIAVEGELDAAGLLPHREEAPHALTDVPGHRRTP